jgi:hypothetical protein
VALLREVDEHELEFPQGEVGERGLVVQRAWVGSRCRCSMAAARSPRRGAGGQRETAAERGEASETCVKAAVG